MGENMQGIINYIRDNEFKMIVLENKIDIVNYLDLLSMNDERVSVSTSFGRIVIKGNDLTVKKLLNKEVLIVGKFMSIEMGE